MDNSDLIVRDRVLRSMALGVQREVRYKLCDMGYYNDAMKGYMIAGMRRMGFAESEIRKAVLGMRAAHDELTAEEAEKVYQEEW